MGHHTSRCVTNSQKVIKRAVHTKRKIRFTKSENVFNSQNVRNTVFNRFNFFASKRYDDYGDYTGNTIHEELKSEYDELSENDREIYQTMANSALERGPKLHQDLVTMLLQTHGSITYREISKHLDFFVGHVCIMNHIKSLDGFSYFTNKVFPHLNEHEKARRV